MYLFNVAVMSGMIYREYPTHCCLIYFCICINQSLSCSRILMCVILIVIIIIIIL